MMQLAAQYSDQLITSYSKRLSQLDVNAEVIEAEANVKRMLQSCRTLVSQFYFLTDSLVSAQGIVLVSEGDTFFKQKLVKTQVKALQGDLQKVLPELSKHQIENLIEKDLQQPKNRQAVQQLTDCFNVRTITQAVKAAHEQDQGISIQVNQRKSGRDVIQYQAITDKCHTLYIIVEKAKYNQALVCCYKFIGAQSKQLNLQKNQGISAIFDKSNVLTKAIILVGLLALLGVGIYQLTLDVKYDQTGSNPSISKAKINSNNAKYDRGSDFSRSKSAKNNVGMKNDRQELNPPRQKPRNSDAYTTNDS